MLRRYFESMPPCCGKNATLRTDISTVLQLMFSYSSLHNKPVTDLTLEMQMPFLP